MFLAVPRCGCRTGHRRRIVLRLSVIDFDASAALRFSVVAVPEWQEECMCIHLFTWCQYLYKNTDTRQAQFNYSFAPNMHAISPFMLFGNACHKLACMRSITVGAVAATHLYCDQQQRRIFICTSSRACICRTNRTRSDGTIACGAHITLSSPPCVRVIECRNAYAAQCVLCPANIKTRRTCIL